MATRNEPRLMIYSQDGLGLGHMRRTSVLAAQFLSACPAASVLTLTDSPTGHFFETASGHDFLKLPSVRKVRPGEWRPVSLAAPFADVLDVRRHVIRSTALAYCPDVLLVDHMPHGAMGELVPTLEALRGGPTRVVLGLRDILDAPATIRRRWRLEGAVAAVERHYDEVLVYGSQEVFDLGAEYDWPDDVTSLVRYCGYVCAPPGSAPAKPLRRRLLRDAPDGKLVLAMAGGGADAHALFETLLRALPRIRVDQPCAMTIVTGPFVSASSWSTMKRLSRGLPVRLIRSVGDTLPYLRAADLVVAMAGYNTTAEILGSGIRALLVPRRGPSAEQQMRASRFADRGWVHWVPPSTLAVETLADAVLAALGSPRPKPAVPPDLDGARRAVQRLLADLSEPAAGSLAREVVR